MPWLLGQGRRGYTPGTGTQSLVLSAAHGGAIAAHSTRIIHCSAAALNTHPSSSLPHATPCMATPFLDLGANCEHQLDPATQRSWTAEALRLGWDGVCVAAAPGAAGRLRDADRCWALLLPPACVFLVEHDCLSQHNSHCVCL